jgi:hypothetical protein
MCSGVRMPKKSGGEGGKPKVRRRRAPTKPLAQRVKENPNVINITPEDRERFQKRLKEAAKRIPDPSPPDSEPATQAGAQARGRPSHAPDPDTCARVAALRAVGATHDVIAMNLGISRATLEKHYQRELAHGFAIIGAEIVGQMTGKALAGDFKAQRLWLETHMGWGKRMPRNAQPTSTEHEDDIGRIPVTAISAPGEVPMAHALPVNEKGDYVAEMTLGLDAKVIKEEAPE